MKAYIKNLWAFLTTSRRYVRPVLLFHLLVITFIIPALVLITKKILAQQDFSTISVDNLSTIITNHFWITLGLILVILLILIFIYLEFTFMIFLAYFVKRREYVTFRQLIFISFSRLKYIRFSTILFFIAYFLFILPLSGLAGSVDFISRIRIPSFVMEVMMTGPWVFKVLYLMVTLLSIYLAWRLIFTLPLIILKEMHLRASMKKSWQLTRKHFWAFFLQVASLMVIVVGVFVLVAYGLVSLQGYIDSTWAQYALQFGIVNLFIIQLFGLIELVLSLVLVFFVIIQLLDVKDELPEQIPVIAFKRFRLGFRILGTFSAILVLLMLLLAVTVVAYEYMQPKRLAQPMLISHRGLSNQEGVQNTIPALEKTSREYHPDYVEMDIRQTKDHKFVVMHDANLKTLANKNWIVEKKNYNQLVGLKLSENGYTAKLPGFDEYFAAANQQQQKLLIEIKTRRGEDPDQVADNFVKQYGAEVVANKAMMHSLDLKVTERLREKLPKTTSSYIMPFNVLGVPSIKANAFSVEVSSLDQDFVWDAHDQNKKVFAWDVDDTDTVQRMQIYQVDALISDNMPLVNKMVRDEHKDLTYAQKLRIYIQDMNNKIFNSFSNTDWQDRDV